MTGEGNAEVTFTADRKALLAAVTWAAKGLPRRPPVPILAGMHVTVDSGTVRLAAFDYETPCSATVAASGTVDGVCVAGGREFVNAVKGMPAGKGATVTVAVHGDSLVVTSGGVTASAGLLPIEDYPMLPVMPAAAGVIASDVFRGTVQRVAVAASRDDTLPALCTVNMVTSAAGVTLTATDRFRRATEFLPWTPADLAGAMDCPWTLNVPAAAAVMFAKAAGKGGKVTVHISEAELPTEASGHASIPPMVGFSDGEREMVTRTDGGEFPRYEKLLPTEFHGLAECDGPAFAAAVKRAGQACDRNTAVHLRVMRDGITVTAWRDGEQSYRETVAGSCESDQRDEGGHKISGWRCAYNPEYLHSLLAGVAGTVRLSWAKPGSPMQVTSGDSDSSYRAILMPIRTPSPR
jgi:DNA polymerase III subunit beta